MYVCIQVINNVDGQFVSATPMRGAVLVFIADLMQRWTSDRYKSVVSLKSNTDLDPLTKNITTIQDRVNNIYNFFYMAESVFAMRLVNVRSVTCYTDQNFKANAHFGALNLFSSEKKVEINVNLEDLYFDFVLQNI